MATSVEVRRGQSTKATGNDSDIILGTTITAENLAAELAKYTVEPGSVAWNMKHYFGLTGAIHVFFDPDGKWYDSTGAEVT